MNGLKKIGVVVCLLMIIGAHAHTPLAKVREGFYVAVNDSKKAVSLLKGINRIPEKTSTIKVYEGATYAILAKTKWNPFSALALLKKANYTMNAAVNQSPTDIEIRFIRFAVQKNIPSFLGYSENLEEDKTYIIQHINRFDGITLNKEMKDYIIYFMEEQGEYNQEELQLIRSKLST